MHDLRTDTLRFLQSLQQPEGGGVYRFSPDLDSPDLYGTCYAVLIRTLLADPISAGERSELAEVINSYQQKRTGLFLDPSSKINSQDPGFSFRTAETTHLCLATLAELDISPRFPLRVMRLIGSRPEAVRNWLDQIQWTKFIEGKFVSQTETIGQEILHFGGMLIRAAETRQANWEAVEALMRWLDENPQTGLWGTNRGGVREECQRATAAIVRLYFYLNRPPPIGEELHGCVAAVLGDYLHKGTTENLRIAWLCLIAEAWSRSDAPRGKTPFNCWRFAPEQNA